MSNYYYALNHTRCEYIDTGDKKAIVFGGGVFARLLTLALARPNAQLGCGEFGTWAGCDVEVVGDETYPTCLDDKLEKYTDVTDSLRQRLGEMSPGEMIR